MTSTTISIAAFPAEVEEGQDIEQMLSDGLIDLALVAGLGSSQLTVPGDQPETMRSIAIAATTSYLGRPTATRMSPHQGTASLIAGACSSLRCHLSEQLTPHVGGKWHESRAAKKIQHSQATNHCEHSGDSCCCCCAELRVVRLSISCLEGGSVVA